MVENMERYIASKMIREAIEEKGLKLTDKAGILLHATERFPGLEKSHLDKILDQVEKLIKFTTIHVDVDTYALESQEHEAQYSAIPGESGSVW